jgi:hypothetical protein
MRCIAIDNVCAVETDGLHDDVEDEDCQRSHSRLLIVNT